MSADADYYEILQVHPSAEPEVIAAAYKRLARKYHPDVNADPQAALYMRRLNEAFEVLGNRDGRSRYDSQRGYRYSTQGDDSPVEPQTAPTTAAGNSATGLGSWLRWIVVLPGAVLAVLLASFPLHWAVLIITSGSNDDGSFGISDLPPETIERMGMAFVSPFAFIVGGAWVAPGYKVHTAIGLAMAWCLLLGAVFAYAASNGSYADWGWLEFGIAIALGIAGVTSGMFQAYEKSRS